VSPRQTWKTTLAAAASRILPSEHGPGAAEANVAQYFDNALAQPYFQALLPWFEGHLDALDNRATERFGHGFAECGAKEQDDLLREIQEAPEPMTQQFFVTLVTLTLEGYLGDPVHGGNRDRLGWRSVGYQPHALRSSSCTNEKGIEKDLS